MQSLGWRWCPPERAEFRQRRSGPKSPHPRLRFRHNLTGPPTRAANLTGPSTRAAPILGAISGTKNVSSPQIDSTSFVMSDPARLLPAAGEPSHENSFAPYSIRTRNQLQNEHQGHTRSCPLVSLRHACNKRAWYSLVYVHLYCCLAHCHWPPEYTHTRKWGTILLAFRGAQTRTRERNSNGAPSSICLGRPHLFW